MFSKGNREPAIDSGAAAAQPNVQAAVAAKRTGKPGGVPSILSAEVIIKGVVVSTGDVQVDGRVEGDIRANSLVVGEKAVIAGDVYAEEATVRGRVEGSISANRVQLASTCRVSGNILHQTLSVESGAFFEGNCRHSDNPLADAPENTPAARTEQRKPNANAAHPKHPAEAAGHAQVKN